VLVVSEVCAGDTILEGVEKEARAAKKGVWIERSPIPPCDYRKAR
jgi:endonuclease YncB( thermonuclease family)